MRVELVDISQYYMDEQKMAQTLKFIKRMKYCNKQHKTKQNKKTE
jgi:hypothetical protein